MGLESEPAQHSAPVPAGLGLSPLLVMTIILLCNGLIQSALQSETDSIDSSGI